MTTPATSTAQDSARQRRVRRTALWLALLALAFYVGFIVTSMSRAHAG